MFYKYMGIFDGMNEHVRKTSREWAEWARRHAHDLSERGVRHLERQDLLAERKRLVARVGAYAVDKMIVEERKSLRADATELADFLDVIRSIDRRLAELENADKEGEEDEKSS